MSWPLICLSLALNMISGFLVGAAYPRHPAIVAFGVLTFAFGIYVLWIA